MKEIILQSILYKIFNNIREFFAWVSRWYAAPSPHFIKHNCLTRLGSSNAIWVETGTFLGGTTRVLSKCSAFVYSIEPEPTLFANAQRRLNHLSNVEILNGTSESIFPDLLPKINGDVNFWLDGHYSAGVTYKGLQETPIYEELEEIRKNVSHFDKVTILVDDVRCFNPHIAEYANYPSIDFLVDWAQENKFFWHIEHDIFIAKNY